MDHADSVEFGRAAGIIAEAARRLGLRPPGFRSPPRVVGAARTVRRRPSGDIVSVRLRGRPMIAVVADMIEGVVVANRLSPPEADRVRTELWSSCASVPAVEGVYDVTERGAA